MSMKWMGCFNHDLPYSIDNPSEKPRERPTQNWRAPTEKREKKLLVFHKPFTAYTTISPSSSWRTDEDTPTQTIVFTIAIGPAGQVGRIRDNHPQWTTSGGMTRSIAGDKRLVLQRRGGGGQVCGWDWWSQDNCNSKSWRRGRLIRITTTPEYVISSSGSGASYLY